MQQGLVVMVLLQKLAQAGHHDYNDTIIHTHLYNQIWGVMYVREGGMNNQIVLTTVFPDSSKQPTGWQTEQKYAPGVLIGNGTKAIWER